MTYWQKKQIEVQREHQRNIVVTVCAATLLFVFALAAGQVFDERYEARMCVNGISEFCKEN